MLGKVSANRNPILSEVAEHHCPSTTMTQPELRQPDAAWTFPEHDWWELDSWLQHAVLDGHASPTSRAVLALGSAFAVVSLLRSAL